MTTERVGGSSKMVVVVVVLIGLGFFEESDDIEGVVVDNGGIRLLIGDGLEVDRIGLMVDILE